MLKSLNLHVITLLLCLNLILHSGEFFCFCQREISENSSPEEGAVWNNTAPSSGEEFSGFDVAKTKKLTAVQYKSYSAEFQNPGFFTNASLLYWQANAENLSYAIKSESSDHLAPHSLINNPDFEWDFGFKIGVGYRIPHDRWECQLHFTSFQTHCDAEKKAQDGHVFLPVWKMPTPQEPFVADQVKMHWRLHLGLLELDLSKPLFISKNLVLLPQISIRTGWIRQKMNIEYLGVQEDLIRMKNKYWGMGPSVGLSAKWSLCTDLSLFAKSSLSVLFGQFYLHQSEDTLKGKEKQLGIHSVFCGSSPIVDAALGLSWHHYFPDRLKCITFTCAWDQLLFFSQNQLMRFVTEGEQGLFISNQGNLSISGIEFNTRLDF